MRLTRWIVGLAVVSTMSLATLAPAAQAVEVDLRTSLVGSSAFPRATGFSEYDRNGTNRDLEVTVRNIAKLAGNRVTVVVNGVKVGTILVSGAGVAHREWDTELGQSVPFAAAGDFVKVKTASGTLVASGKYVVSRD